MEELEFLLADGEAEVVPWPQALEVTPPPPQVVGAVILAGNQHEDVDIFLEEVPGNEAGVELGVAAVE